MKRTLLILALCLTPHALPSDSRVVEVDPARQWAIVSHPAKEPWALGHTLCLGPKKTPIVCGWVTEASDFEAWLKLNDQPPETIGPNVKETEQLTLVQLKFRKKQIKVGTPVFKKAIREVTTIEEVEPFTESEEKLVHYTALLKDHIYPATAITAGLDFVFPTIHVQQALSQSFATGLEGMYLRYPTSLGEFEGGGAKLTFNWYSDAPFTGTFFKIGAGIFSFQGQLNGTRSQFYAAGANLDLGYKWRWKSGVNFGLGLGAQSYLALTQPSNGFTLPTVLPSIAMDFGFAF